MRGLDPDERHALSNAGSYVLTDEVTEKLLRRGLIGYDGVNGEDRWYRMTSEGRLALKLDTLARSGVQA